MSKKLICVPFAYEANANSGVNISSVGEDRLHMYLKNACVALVSAKKHNPECEVALATNLTENEIPYEYRNVLRNEDIAVLQIPFDCFCFPKEYKWALAFYKLCVLSHIAQMQYDYMCYLDTDVFIQERFDMIWEECDQHILLYDVALGMQSNDFANLDNDLTTYFGERRLITLYGGEFFAARKNDAQRFIVELDSVYSEVIKSGFQVQTGDEFIINLAADRMKGYIKNAGAYVYRFWTGPVFRWIASCYYLNRVSVLHLPAEKERGMLTMYDRYVRNGVLPNERKIWRVFRLSRMPLKDKCFRIVLPLRRIVLIEIMWQFAKRMRKRLRKIK